MNSFCVLRNLSVSDWAAWVQAIGSILAIAFSVLVAVYAAERQHENARRLQADERRTAKIEAARTLAVLSKNCLALMAHLAAQLKDRAAVYSVAEGHAFIDVGTLSRQDDAIAAMPIYSFPSSLVTPIMLLGATIRQFREKVEQVLRVHRTMDASQFMDFFRCLQEMQESLRKTAADIDAEVARLERGSVG